jgi:transaldolase
MTRAAPLDELTSAGVSVWLDDLSRDQINNGTLARRIEQFHVTGVTTNPAIFARSIGHGEAYRDAIDDLRAQHVGSAEALRILTAQDVRAAADLLRPVYERTNADDGYVSIEVDPSLSYDPAGTVAAARHLHWLVDRPNVMVKIPATKVCLPAVTAVLAEGISVNVTLIFSPTRYAEVFEAALAGIEQARDAGFDVQRVRSVASFFVSRIDSKIEALARDDDGCPCGLSRLRDTSVGIASATQAYEKFRDHLRSKRVQALLDHGGAPQRPLWASTGVKNPNSPDTLYVDGLVARGSINTMPAATLEAFADHGSPGVPVDATSFANARTLWQTAEGTGLRLDDLADELEYDGVRAFQEAWVSLEGQLADQLTGITPTPTIPR